MSIRFEITSENADKIDMWLKGQIYPSIIEEQRAREMNPHPMMIDMWDKGYPYDGAIGGGLTYEFTPTSIGVIFKVKYGKHELDLTDYDSW